MYIVYCPVPAGVKSVDQYTVMLPEEASGNENIVRAEGVRDYFSTGN
jgi:hypothetical protein